MDRFDVENGILSLMFLDDKLEYVKLNKLSKDLFELPSNQAIYEKIVKLRESNKPYDMLLLYQGYGFTQPEAEQIRLYQGHISGIHNFDYYYNALIRSYYERKAQDLASGKIDFETYNESINKFSKIDKDLKMFNTKRDMVSFMNELKRIMEGNFALYKMGIEELDEQLGDIIDGTMMVIGGKTSTGKTWLMLQSAFNLAKQGHKVLYLSCEMGKTKLIKRIIQSLTGINVKVGSNPTLEENEEYCRIYHAAEEVEKVDLTIVETSAFNEKVINELIKSTGAKIIFLDFIQQFNLGDKAESRASQLSDIANNIKRMTQRHETLTIVGSQLNRTGGVGDLGAIKESNGIPESADIVIMLERLDSTYDKDLHRISYNIHVSKNRDGQTGIVPLDFSYRLCKFISK